MTSGTRGKVFVQSVAIASVAMAIAAGPVSAQMPGTPMADPNMQPSPYMQTADPNAKPESGKKVFKQLFAGTLTAVLQATGAGLATGVASAMTGAIQNWFNKPPKASAGMDPAASMGGMQPAPGMAMGGMPPSADMSMGGMNAAPAMPMGDMNAMPGSMGMPQTGMTQEMGAMPAMPPATVAGSGIYAGLAFEVQAIRNGQSMTVDPATHSFATGDRFVVMYRPSLPGRVDIYNVNPLGQEKQIDSVNVAAGELTRLGPYEFRATTGREVLRLILSPCRNDALMATTRDIVKVDEMAGPVTAASSPGALVLPDCAVVATRGDRPQTRDIVKVGAEDGTIFALDAVSQQEIQAGNFTPRELTLTFSHY